MKKVQKLNFLAPAKINLYLYVLYRRDDGYHEIASLIVPICLFDVISISRKEKGVEVTCSGGIDVPEGEDNIAFAAASLFLDHYSLAEGVRIEIEKNIPAGSGLGGGSSDAAAVLKALSILFLGKIDAERLLDLASRIGSDVPFFIYPFSAKVAGRGEKVTPLEFKGRFHVLIVKPDVSISTQEAYGLLGRERGKRAFDGNQPDVVNSLDDLKGILHNDFEDAVFARYGKIRELKEKMIDAGAEAALMSGSGSSIFGLFEGKEEAWKAKREFTRDEGVFVKLVSNF